MMRRLAVLGSTGSIGTQALEVAALYPERFRVVALTAMTRKEELFAQVRQFQPEMAGLAGPGLSLADVPPELRDRRWVFGKDALTAAAGDTGADDVLVSVVGMAGLESVLTALSGGSRVLLANKEALVAGGALVTEAARRRGTVSRLPVDSEKSASVQCLPAAQGNAGEEILLTCSGGPSRTWDREAVRAATRAQALKHPTWTMGQKITVDSATLFNKALEIIEAKWLFGVGREKIRVVIHPQSVVHSAVRFADGAVLAQLGAPDMKVPILYAMAYPERLPTGGKTLDLFTSGALTFEKPDEERFPSLRLAAECLDAGGAAACVMNAANEVAVARFLQADQKDCVNVGRIYDVVEETLQRVGWLPAGTLDDVLEADRRARETARALLG